MQQARQQFLVVIFTALLILLAACGNPAMEQVPTPTPVDAALQRLYDNATAEAQQAAAAADTETEAAPVADTASEAASQEVAATGGGGGMEIFSSNGCMACHAVEGDGAGMLGPTLAGIAATAEERIAAADYSGEATTATEYINESIVNPQAYIVPDYSPVMPSTYESTIPADQLETLVAYLESLE